jgi:hypothetical protein
MSTQITTNWDGDIQLNLNETTTKADLISTLSNLKNCSSDKVFYFDNEYFVLSNSAECKKCGSCNKYYCANVLDCQIDYLSIKSDFISENKKIFSEFDWFDMWGKLDGRVKNIDLFLQILIDLIKIKTKMKNLKEFL